MKTGGSSIGWARIAMFVAVVACFVACKKEQPAASPAAESNVGRALAAYEAIRDKLAQDNANAVTGDAAALQAAAKAAATEASPNARPHLESLATAAGKLYDMKKDDAEAVRSAFGDVSASTVALLAADPSLQAGRHVFYCPMVEGYQKWVQVDEKISNPYMGTRMLECGAESDWK